MAWSLDSGVNFDKVMIYILQANWDISSLYMLLGNNTNICLVQYCLQYLIYSAYIGIVFQNNLDTKTNPS